MCLRANADNIWSRIIQLLPGVSIDLEPNLYNIFCRSQNLVRSKGNLLKTRSAPIRGSTLRNVGKQIPGYTYRNFFVFIKPTSNTIRFAETTVDRCVCATQQRRGNVCVGNVTTQFRGYHGSLFGCHLHEACKPQRRRQQKVVKLPATCWHENGKSNMLEMFTRLVHKAAEFQCPRQQYRGVL